MATDNITRYLSTVASGQMMFCQTCRLVRFVWMGETEGGDIVTCCANCQHVLLRSKSDEVQG
jgi:hypothetical protein